MAILELLRKERVWSTRHRPRKKRRSVPRRAKSRARRISVIIPAHNEEAYLERTLLALRRQDYPCEIIVVANGCSDRTADVAREHCDRLVVLSQKCLGVARNLGARMATGDLLLFLDADTLLSPNALRTIAREFTRNHAAGTVQGRPDSSRLVYRGMYLLKNLTHCTHFHEGSCGVILCWRKHFMQLGGFDENLEVCENSELMGRLKKFGNYSYIGDAIATTSMRRYERLGVRRMIWHWTRVWIESFFSDLHHRKYETVR